MTPRSLNQGRRQGTIMIARSIVRPIAALAALVLAIVAAHPALAQSGSGSLFGTVKDDKGAPLPGVTVTLSGDLTAAQIQVSNAQGEVRFLGLAPGAYHVASELQGFSRLEYPNVVVSVGHNTSLELTMSAAVEDVITVTSESPLLDERKISTGANLSRTELQGVPSGRDPWTILQTVPGVLMDRINIGGNESGQQSGYTSPGAPASQSTWAIDGVTITDFGALGSSPAYFDFDAFQEMNFETGGADAATSSPGVVLNLVTKRATNDWRAAGKFVYDSDKMQSSTNLSQSKLGPAQPRFNRGNQIDSVNDRGAEIGGPLWKDHLWVWAAYDNQQINKLNPSSATVAKPVMISDKTSLESKNGKLNAQITASNSASATYFDNAKVKLGRNITGLALGDQGASADQGHAGALPTFWKAEDTQMLGDSFYVTGTYNETNGGFGFTPEGGDREAYIDSNGVQFISTGVYQSLRPQKQAKLDASSFFSTGEINHELKFGAGYRKADVDSISHWAGGGFVTNNDYLGLLPSGSAPIFAAQRAFVASFSVKEKSAFVQDTMTSGRATFNAGVHYERQHGGSNAVVLPANRYVPDVLPKITTAANDNPFTWTNVEPRLGFTYALGATHKTLLRASFSQYADNLGPASVLQNAATAASSYAYFYTTNTNGQSFSGSQIGALIQAPLPVASVSKNRVSSGLKAPTTDELLLSAEHALLPEFSVGVNFTYRKYKDPLQAELLVGDGFTPDVGAGRRATRADYVPVNVPLLNGRTATVYKLRSNLGFNGGSELFNGDWSTTYEGLALVATKRLANRWMMRGNVTLSSWKNDVGSNSFANPTQCRIGSSAAATDFCAGLQDGDQVISAAAGSGKPAVFINARYSFNVNGLYQVAPDRPWGFNVAGSFYGRQGYPTQAYQVVAVPGGQGLDGRALTYSVQSTSRPDDRRYDNITLLDLRVEKEFTFSHVGLTAALECFNVGNSAYVLGENARLGQSNSNWVQEVTSPRVFRLGARLSFQ